MSSQSSANPGEPVANPGEPVANLDAPVTNPAAPVANPANLPRREQHRRFNLTENTQSMIDSLNTLRKDDIMTDLTLNSSEKSFPCHKVILASASEYFKTALNSGFKETQSGEIEFSNIHPDILHVILEYIYGQEVTLEAANVLDLHSASHLMQINGLVKITKDFMLTNFEECYQHQSFLDFPLPHLIEYISDSCLEVRNEDEVYKAVVRWVRHDLPQRENATADLMAHVRLPYCTRSFFCQVIMQDDHIKKYCHDILSEAIAFHLVPSSKSTTHVKPRVSSMTIGLEEKYVLKYVTKEEGIMLSSQNDKHEYSLEILGELPHMDLVSGYSMCASDTTVVITGGNICVDKTIHAQPVATGFSSGGSSFGSTSIFGQNVPPQNSPFGNAFSSDNRTRSSATQQHSWSLNTLNGTWSQMPKLPHGTFNHSSIITDGTIFTQSNNKILMLEPKAKQWSVLHVLVEQNCFQIIDGNSKYLLLVNANPDEKTDYYLFDRIGQELTNLRTAMHVLLKFIDDELLALCKGMFQFKSFYWYDFTKKVWKCAGFVQAQCDGVDEKSKACVWKGNLVLTYPKGLAIFNPDTAILRHFVSCKIDNYDKCNIFPIFVSDSD